MNSETKNQVDAERIAFAAGYCYGVEEDAAPEDINCAWELYCRDRRERALTAPAPESPGAEDIEAIRARHEVWPADSMGGPLTPFGEACADRATLLGRCDQLFRHYNFTKHCFNAVVKERDAERAARVKAEAKLAEVREAADGWQPIETAPREDYERVLLWQDAAPDGHQVDVFYRMGGVWRGTDWEGSPALSPTHWRPLPPPPAALAKDAPR